jgi:hypothetical protein
MATVPRKMAAVGVAQAPLPIVIFNEEQRSVGAFDCILEEKPVHRFQESLRAGRMRCVFRFGGAFSLEVLTQQQTEYKDGFEDEDA